MGHMPSRSAWSGSWVELDSTSVDPLVTNHVPTRSALTTA